MTRFVIILSILPFLAVCQGQLIALPVKNHASLCTGDSASLQLEIAGSKGNPRIVWSHGKSLLDDSEHYSLGENGAVLNIKNVLPPHAGKYYAVVTDGVNTEKATFSVEVHDIFLRALVKSPFKINPGGKGTLSVEKSIGGQLWWIHRGKLISAQDSHYKFGDTQDTTKAQLEILEAGEEQEGLYEIVLKQAACEIRNVIEVQLARKSTQSELMKDTSTESGFFNFSVTTYVLPAILVPMGILIVIALILFIKRKPRKADESSEDYKPDVSAKPVTHVLFDDPIYTMQDQVFYPAADPSFDIAPLTSSHPHSSSLGRYGGMSEMDNGNGIYGNTEDIYGTFGRMAGPSVPPPSTGNKHLFRGTISEEFPEFFLDD